MLLKVGPDEIYRGARPISIFDWLDLKRAGVKTVISLEMGYFEWFHAQMNEEVEMAAQYDMTPVHLQLDDVFPPAEDALESVVSMIQNAKNNGGVYFHCRWGKDRTGLVAALVRVKLQGWKPEDALKEMFDLGFHKIPYQYLGWVDRLETLMNRAKGTS